MSRTDLPSSSAPSTEGPTELKRVMGPGLLLLFIIGDILGTGIYALTGQVAGEVGGAAWLPFVIAFAVALVTACSYLGAGHQVPAGCWCRPVRAQGVRQALPDLPGVLHRDVLRYHLGVSGLAGLRGESGDGLRDRCGERPRPADRPRFHVPGAAGQPPRCRRESQDQCAADRGGAFRPAPRRPDQRLFHRGRERGLLPCRRLRDRLRQGRVPGGEHRDVAGFLRDGRLRGLSQHGGRDEGPGARLSPRDVRWSGHRRTDLRPGVRLRCRCGPRRPARLQRDSVGHGGADGRARLPHR
ncbi:hypothetical protein SHIRM173S_01211 [Streptomyces hirsutus]